MFGLSFPKLALVGIIAVFILGPDRLPQMAARLASLAKTVRNFSDSAKERVREEMGPEFDDFDWQKLDPRQYDPRRIIREALLDDERGDGVPPTEDAPRVRLAKPALSVETEKPPEATSIDINIGTDQAEQPTKDSSEAA